MQTGLGPLESDRFDDIVHSITDGGDYWMVLADFRAYIDTQAEAARAFLDRERWLTLSILNCAASGKFSTDRTIREYNRDIWKLDPITAPTPGA